MSTPTQPTQSRPKTKRRSSKQQLTLPNLFNQLPTSPDHNPHLNQEGKIK